MSYNYYRGRIIIFVSSISILWGSSKKLQLNFFASINNPSFSNLSLLPKTPIKGIFKVEKADKDFGSVTSPVCTTSEGLAVLNKSHIFEIFFKLLWVSPVTPINKIS